MKRSIVLIAHNLRSTHNVGSLLRTADGLGITKVFLTGYTPYPISSMDERLPHIAHKLHAQIHKTALGAEESVAWEHHSDITEIVQNLKDKGYEVVALEQTKGSRSLLSFEPTTKVAIIVGREVEGIEPSVLALTDATIEIPMDGKKESFNVSIAAAIALYHLRHM